MISHRSQDKLDRINANIIERHRGEVLVKTVMYDFSKLNTVEEAEEFERYISMFTYDNDVGIIVNNVGRCWHGKFHEQPYEMIFNMLSVNIASQLCLSKVFLSKWAKERKGKKCAIINMSGSKG